MKNWSAYFDKNKSGEGEQVVKETKTSCDCLHCGREEEIVPRDKIIEEEFVTSDRAYLRPDRK